MSIYRYHEIITTLSRRHVYFLFAAFSELLFIYLYLEITCMFSQPVFFNFRFLKSEITCNFYQAKITQIISHFLTTSLFRIHQLNWTTETFYPWVLLPCCMKDSLWLPLSDSAPHNSKQICKSKQILKGRLRCRQTHVFYQRFKTQTLS